MRTSVRTTALAIAGFGLAASPLLAAGPASAAPPAGGLTQSTCQEGGGVYTFIKGKKTCVTTVIEVIDNYNGPNSRQQQLIKATWLIRTFGELTVVTTQTQKGKTFTSFETRTGELSQELVVESRTCEVDGDDGFTPIAISICEDGGFYDGVI